MGNQPSQCQCYKSDGLLCERNPSSKTGDDPTFCWQHQSCKTPKKTIPVTVNKSPQVVPQPLKVPQPVKAPQVAQIVANLPLSNSQKLTRLSGPSTFYYFNNVIGKRVLLLGEAHDVEGLCDPTGSTYEVHQWLHDLAVNAPECLDIFVEKSYQTAQDLTPLAKKLKPLAQYDAPVSAVKAVFNPCHTANSEVKKTCVSSQVRYHYIDARGFKSVVKSPLLEWYLKLGASTFFKAGHIAEKFFENNYQMKLTIFKYLLGLDRTSEARVVFEAYLDAMSEILKTPWNKTSLQTYMQLYYDLIDKETQKMSSVVSKTKFFKVLLQIYLDSSADVDLSAFIIPQDVYFLLRLFMRFDTDKLNRGPSGCQAETYYKVRNAIVYGGGSHIKIYERFIRRYFKIQPNIGIVNNYKDKCIQLPSEFDFFQAIKNPIKVPNQ